MNRSLRVSAVLALGLLTGCMKQYTVTAGAEPGHYIVVQQKTSGAMKVLDCRSKPADEAWAPECRKAVMKD